MQLKFYFWIETNNYIIFLCKCKIFLQCLSSFLSPEIERLSCIKYLIFKANYHIIGRYNSTIFHTIIKNIYYLKDGYNFGISMTHVITFVMSKLYTRWPNRETVSDKPIL